MKIAKVLGTVTLSRAHPDLHGARLRAVEALEDVNQLNQTHWGGDLIIAWDGVSAGNGDLVALAEGPEAAQPFRPRIRPLDAYLAAILDHVEIPTDTSH